MISKTCRKLFLMSLAPVLFGTSSVFAAPEVIALELSAPAPDVPDHSWAQVVQLNAARNAAVKQSYMAGQISKFVTAKWRQSALNHFDPKSSNGSGPDANQLTNFCWFTDRAKWRIDSIDLYPYLGPNYKMQAFNGEQYTGTDAANFQGGAFSDEAFQSYFPGPRPELNFRTFAQDVSLGGGALNFFQSSFVAPGTVPEYRGDETLNGIPCEKFESQKADLQTGPSTTATMWFSVACEMPIKWRFEFFRGRELKQAFLIGDEVAQGIRKISGVYVATGAKTETYGVGAAGKLTWQSTYLITTTQVEINDEDAVSAFGHPAQVGAPMLDRVNGGRRWHTIGGDPREFGAMAGKDPVTLVQDGTPPPLEEPGAEVDGAAPAVVIATLNAQKLPDPGRGWFH